MWIRKDDYLGLLKENSSLQTTVELKQVQIASLQKELEYWRGKFEEQLNRADRVNDKLTEASGFGPVSDLGVSEAKRMRDEMERMMKEAGKQGVEMFSDGDIGVDEDLASALVQGLGK